MQFQCVLFWVGQVVYQVQFDVFLWLQLEYQVVWCGLCVLWVFEQLVGDWFQCDYYVGGVFGQVFVGDQVEWYVVLVLVVDMCGDIGEGFYVVVFWWLVGLCWLVVDGVGGVVVVDVVVCGVFCVEWVKGVQYFDFFVVDVVGFQ